GGAATGGGALLRAGGGGWEKQRRRPGFRRRRHSQWGFGGSDGDRSRANTLSFLLRADPFWLRPIPERRRVGPSTRDAPIAPRRRTLDPDGLHLIASLSAQGRTLREIAAEVGVSHETVRALLRERRSALLTGTPGTPRPSPPRTP
ncbi:MAG: hypothetical protein M3R02_20910, partial [Chloroflexota bacterium]|nr:hypothetical protein [Chloroflexota bacterium]